MAGPALEPGWDGSTPRDLDFAINHVFLPPKLPQSDDTSASGEVFLLRSFLTSMCEFSNLQPEEATQLRPLMRMIEQFLRLQVCEPKETVMAEILQSLDDGESAVFYIREQNAGLLLTGQASTILVQAFELLSDNCSVMSSRGCLIRQFPDAAAEVPRALFCDQKFTEEFVAVLCKLTTSPIAAVRPKTRKANAEHDEVRDTTSPILVTSMLVGVLHGLGKAIKPTTITKRMREQVNWNNAKQPFHRSPLWILLRVAIRIVLGQHTGHTQADSLYKTVSTFYHASLLAKATEMSLSSDIRFTMTAKLLRRIKKIAPLVELPWITKVNEIRAANHRNLESRWRDVQQYKATPLALDPVETLQFCGDTNLRLEQLNHRLAWIRSRPSDKVVAAGPGDKTTMPRTTLVEFPILSSDQEMRPFFLLNFEAWVDQNLSSWVASQLKKNNKQHDAAAPCIRKLESNIEEYLCLAQDLYANDPESLSVMHLVIMELWVALDRLAGDAIPLLLEYNPGFIPGLFEPLLLPTARQMERLHAIEHYLVKRQKGRYPPMFSDFGTVMSFAVRYFDASLPGGHRNLHEQIVSSAERCKREKLEEYREKRHEWSELVSELSRTCHDQNWNEYARSLECSWGCKACGLEAKIKQKTIKKFEWPLPTNSNKAKAVVFELAVPSVVRIWRDTTVHIFLDVLIDRQRWQGRNNLKLYYPEDHSGLHPFKGSTSKIHLASRIKSVERSHYGNAEHISKYTEADVCVEHGCQYDYYHTGKGVEYVQIFDKPSIDSGCSHAAHEHNPHLSKFIRQSSHDSNYVISSQEFCPQAMTLEEFKAFGHHRVGDSLQWANTLSQLTIPSLDLNRQSTFLLILQSCTEAGARDNSGSAYRKAHDDLTNDIFTSSLLGALEDAFVRVHKNWQNDIAVGLLACLATRILSLTHSHHVSQGILAFLARIRSTTIGWARDLLSKRANSCSEDERQALAQRALMSALICLSSFDMKSGHLKQLLSSSEELSQFVEAAIMACDHVPSKLSDPVSRFMACRGRGVMYQAMGILREEVVGAQNSGFGYAIQHFWADYMPSQSGWTAREGPQSHILQSFMSEDGQATCVTWNMLTGQLLVNGYPLSRLPRNFELDPSYSQLFGTRVLEVMPSTLAGMQFSACRDQDGWVVHFSMMEGRVVTQAVRRGASMANRTTNDGEIWEFIPRSCFTGDLPLSFISGFSHWRNKNTGIIEFRPAATPWQLSSDHWILAKEGDRTVLRQGQNLVVDPHSSTAMTLSVRLKPLESKENIDIIFHHGSDSKQLSIHLPRFALSFSLAPGESMIRSKHYAGMVIDECQRVGTLIGLRSKLVLRDEQRAHNLRPSRLVVVPRGQANVSLKRHHVRVKIRTADKPHIKHEAFKVDTLLGRLIDNGSLTSKLYLSLLHALTSHCLPDPLTNRTGTEEATRLLQLAAVRSFQRLDSSSIGILKEISSLSPQRVFYPEHLTVMEQCSWNHNLPVLSQYDGFRADVEKIMAHAEDCEVLHEPAEGGTRRKIHNLTTDVKSHLLAERAIIRNATFRVTEFGAENHSTRHDIGYRGRQNDGQEAQRSSIVRNIASLVYSGTPQLLFPATPKLRPVILSTTGVSFPGNPSVDLRFSSGYFCKHGDALKGLWCGLHRALTIEENKYRVIFFLSSLSFATDANLDLVQALLAIATHRALFGSLIKPPDEESFDLAYDHHSLQPRVTNIVRDKRYPRDQCPAISLSKGWRESEGDFEARRRKEWQSESSKMVKALVSDMKAMWLRSWIIARPSGHRSERWIDIDAVMPETNKTLDLTRRSILFTAYLDRLLYAVQDMNFLASSQDVLVASSPGLDTVRGSVLPTSRLGFIKDTSLFSNPAPETHRPLPERFLDLLEEIPQICVEQRPITDLVEHLSSLGKRQPHQLSYIEELRHSSESVATAQLRLKADDQSSHARLSDYLNKCQKEESRISHDITMALSGNGVVEKLCINSDFYPRLSPIFFLQHLRRDRWNKLSTKWRVCLLNYALSLTYLQRAERLVNSHGFANRRVDFLKELQNFGHHDSEDCDPLEWPEYVLLEVEQGILIRPVQHQIAANMRKPPGGKSSVMQLNMGEGKSSVIVPIVSTAVSDGSCLARVIVAKAQAKQMEHTLVSAIGGLLGRRTFYLPISRAVRMDDNAITTVARMIRRCKEEGGVLLVQPEHILSFKLMGLEGIWNELAVAQKILSTYSELETISRDIVDESDENFSVKFELIYTMGNQQPVDMSPDRWVLIQDLMDIVSDVAKQLKHGRDKNPGSTEGLLFEERGTGRFPTIRTLDESTGAELVEATAHKLCSLGMRGLPVQHQTKQMRQAVLQYILDPNVDQQHIEMVENDRSGLFEDSTMRKGLFLLRGLLANGVLQFALGQKRFRVNYGLAPDRQPPTLLAVPYRAKDSPAPRSEFSHTDVVIILTCLSYYYRGLTDTELFLSLELLLNSDRAEQEYSSWSRASPLLDPALRHFSAVNLKDKTLCTKKLFPGLRFTKSAVDYYLSNIVFPKEMREFPFKLSSSGWDLAKPKTYPLTGFSGTTDSKTVLPLSITPLDLPEQRYTNSHVLACLLQSENTVMELGNDQRELCALTVKMLLSAVTKSDQSMRVILDVGAQIIELSNFEFSKHWLSLVSDADAVIFFSDNDELSVLTRDGTVESFYTSPFRTQTERCLVFLDQAHTRGTDLRLPDSYRAAVTLGPGVTKDTLVQACMRMRKLGNGQSVTFCLSAEMQKRIRDLENMDISRHINVMHILTFAISETWDDAHRSVPLWATQGLRHQRQEEIINRVGGYSNLRFEDARKYLEDEAQTLEMRYRARAASARGQSQSLSAQLEDASSLASRQTDVAAIQTKCIEFGFSNLNSIITLEEEQERELAPEIEQERHVERPALMKPLEHSLHPDVEHFATTGTMKPNSSAFLPAFHAMIQSSASKVFAANKFPTSLLITEDFSNTVRPTRASYCSDSYQRSVQWILTREIRKDDELHQGPSMHMVIISPYEANIIKRLLLDIPGRPVTLHSYLPRSSLSFHSMEDLKTFTYPPMTPKQLEEWMAPPELITQLNLFAGQLYLQNYAEYVRTCQYLGLSYTENKSDGTDGVVVGADGFVGQAGGKGYENCPFEESPVGFLSVLYKRLRRDCTNIDRTHMGIVLAGGILTKKDFEGVEGDDEQWFRREGIESG